MKSELGAFTRRRKDNEDRVTHLRLDQDQVNEQDHKVMLNIFVGESFAIGALRQAYPFTKRTIIRLAVNSVEVFDGSAAGDAYRHACLERKGCTDRLAPYFCITGDGTRKKKADNNG